MGVYIKRYGDYVMIGSQVPQEGYEWYDGEIPQIIPELQYLKWENNEVVIGHIYNEDELKRMAHEININEYIIFCKENDNDIMKYEKRHKLGIDTEEDYNDYINALEIYKQKTLEYKEMKERITNMTTEELEKWINDNNK